MSLFKRGGTWWYKFRWSLKVNGERKSYEVRRSAKTGNHREALRREQDHKTALGRGEVHPLDPFPKVAPSAPKPVTLAAYAEIVLRHVALHRKERTVAFYQECLKRISRFKPLAEPPITAITADLIDAYIDWRRSAKRGNSVYAINAELRTLRRVLYFAEEKGQIAKAPAVHELAGADPRARVISQTEEAEYLRAAAPRLRSIAILAVDTGLRPNSELFPLRWEHVSQLAIRVAHGKTPSAARTVPLTPRAAAVLAALRAERDEQAKGAVVRIQSPWVFPASSMTGHITTIQKAHDRALRDAKLEPFEFYCWRHTFGTRCAEAGMDKYAIAQLMGHSSPAVAEKNYIKVSTRHVSANFERFVEYQAKQLAEALGSASESAKRAKSGKE
jgi:integrase